MKRRLIALTMLLCTSVYASEYDVGWKCGWSQGWLFREAQTKDAAFAISSGIVHQIKDVQIPVGAPVFSLVFQR